MNFRRSFASLVLSCAFGTAYAQTSALNCVPGAAPKIVRSEGLTERLGDIVLTCSGGVPGATVSTNLTIFLPVSVTNKLTPANTADIVLTSDAPVTGAAAVVSGNSVSINGITFTVPSTGNVTLRVSNVLAAVNALGLDFQQPIQAFLSAGSLSLTAANVSVGVPARGLLASSVETVIACTGSPLPETPAFSSLIATGTAVTSTRVTEGITDAFQPKLPLTDTGTRIMFRYTGFPASARLFLPDAVAGSSALEPTSAGDMGLPVSAGRYVPASGTLLLVRVLNPDANGAGGTLAVAVPVSGTDPVSFDSASEVPLTEGAGIAVYEVVDANPNLRENAQLPTFVGLGRLTGAEVVEPIQTVSFAPLSTVATASATAPVPRFAQSTPGLDCTVNGDCQASYVPAIVADPASLSYRAASGGLYRVDYMVVKNGSGGALSWRANIVYKSGSGWLTVNPGRGGNSGRVRVDAHPENLAPGTYEATINFDGGRAGILSVPVIFEVTPQATTPSDTEPPIEPSDSGPSIELVANAATYRNGPIAPNSLAMIKGARLAGQQVSVSFDGVPANMLYASDAQINVLVPAELASRTVAQVLVTADGKPSNVASVILEPIAPGIFQGGILNEDGSANAELNPVLTGRQVTVFATGLPGTAAEGTITAKIHDREITAPASAGTVAGVAGVQQITFVVPEDLPAMTTEVLVCGSTSVSGQRTCSAPAKISLRK